jgi:transposase-like protein
MNGSGFQALVAQLGELSEVQRKSLLTPLKRKLPIDEAVALIDARFEASACCGHCGSTSVGSWSSQSGLVRYRCKDCGGSSTH